ncbi:hypothetical protein HNR74_000204 [Flammeovirga kamogawensis]|nr:hypothetical protein [Flammeovirga kamogawensis]
MIFKEPYQKKWNSCKVSISMNKVIKFDDIE